MVLNRQETKNKKMTNKKRGISAEQKENGIREKMSVLKATVSFSEHLICNTTRATEN